MCVNGECAYLHRPMCKHAKCAVCARINVQVDRARTYIDPNACMHSHVLIYVFREGGTNAPSDQLHARNRACRPPYLKESTLQHPPATSRNSRTQFPAEDQALLTHSLRRLVIDYVV